MLLARFREVCEALAIEDATSRDQHAAEAEANAGMWDWSSGRQVIAGRLPLIAVGCHRHPIFAIGLPSARQDGLSANSSLDSSVSHVEMALQVVDRSSRPSAEQHATSPHSPDSRKDGSLWLSAGAEFSPTAHGSAYS